MGRLASIRQLSVPRKRLNWRVVVGALPDECAKPELYRPIFPFKKRRESGVPTHRKFLDRSGRNGMYVIQTRRSFSNLAMLTGRIPEPIGRDDALRVTDDRCLFLTPPIQRPQRRFGSGSEHFQSTL